ncbi:hypothetical protein T439DRAFT_112707 [Meredithblackwellia eburnea MCA 4105]
MTATYNPFHLYRNILRIAKTLPDVNRAAIVCFRARQDTEGILKLKIGSAEFEERCLGLEVYADNLEHQSQHLKQLSKQRLLIPIDLRKPHVHTAACNHSNEEKTLRGALRAAKSSSKDPRGERVLEKKNRFMSGPEPSWLKKKTAVS